ncbi:fasciclin domain-containing protein [Ancylothrix sp. C2]|uniref:fasciclin domain-containing protein n=1 Tax=Ancylothrix sp. D3o TaxID=2953691 RepID=UPI0021BB4F1A|nr:fasciclin domain-containing protein [Ancylothrix sp. D3o]MCT7951706.1 fasciclin domain-containing protein [Ancylothrix sp. D3o]
MQARYKNLMLKVAGFVGVVAVSLANSGAVLAQYYYGPSFFSPGAYYPARAGSLIGQLKQLGFSRLARVLEGSPELVNTLNQGGPFTIFAPTDEAFDALPAGTLEQLMKDKPQLAKVLSYHLVPGKVTEADIQAGQVKTLEGNVVNLGVNAATNQITLNNAKPVDDCFNIKNRSDNTITFVVIDKVLLPPQR